MEENLHDGHRNRLRGLAYNSNFKNIPEHQLLELLLTYVIPRKDTNPIAHKLIKEFGSYSGVLDAKPEDLMKVKGVGEKTANFLVSIKHFFFAYNENKMNKNATILNTLDAVNFIRNFLSGKSNEEFYVICIDNSNKVKLYEHISSGVVNKTNVDIRKIMEVVFKSNSCNVIVCHNHPSGSSKPSYADDKLTKAVLTTLTLNGINLLDHIIISSDDYFSYNRSGTLTKYYEEVKTLLSSPMAMQKPCEYNKLHK